MCELDRPIILINIVIVIVVVVVVVEKGYEIWNITRGDICQIINQQSVSGKHDSTMNSENLYTILELEPDAQIQQGIKHNL